MILTNKVKRFCEEKGLTDIGDSVLCGLSGGADSVCLLFILLDLKKELDLEIRAFHLNHGIRGAEADRDEKFCRDLCERLGVPFVARRVSVPDLSKASGLGEEETGRIERYRTMEEEAEKLGCNKIAVAHHADDNVETFLFQMLRGSRLHGLSGMPGARDGKIIRPLLTTSKAEILAHLSDIGEAYVTDSTNLLNDCSRNRLRNIVIPELLMIQPRAREHILALSDYLRTVSEHIDAETEKTFSKIALTEPYGDGVKVSIDIGALLSEDVLLQKNVIYEGICLVTGRKKDITGEYVDSVLALAKKQTGRSVMLKYGVKAKRSYKKLVLVRENGEEPIDNSRANCNNCFGYEISEKVPTDFPDGKSCKLFDYGKLCERFGGRPEEKIICGFASEDDFITVYEDGRSKRVFDVMKNAGISSEERRTVPVLKIGKEALLIKNVRGSETCRCDGNTKKAIYVRFDTEEEV